MRIRKRQPPLYLSSDPNSDNSPVVQLHNHNNNHPHPHHNLPQLADAASYLQSQASSHQPNPPIGTGTNGLDCSDYNQDKKDCSVLVQEENKSNDSRMKNLLGAEIVGAGVHHVSDSTSSHPGVGRWCEGEKAFPLKKRRGNFERNKAGNEEEITIVEKDNNNNNKKMKTKMKTKMNKKFGLKDIINDNDQQEAKEMNIGENNISSSAKKRGRGGALMEGSRCSRVNGRGWRCCQQTLVGYSLCEHHLGKGRLRSITSVRSRALGTSAPLSTAASLSIKECQPKPEGKDEDEDDDEDDEDDDEKPLMIGSSAAAKKRTKLGMVKARSMSSLLGQTNNEITVSDK
ncbi:hypothetical protein LWI29_026246 [Acer saccharum]|uniref:WRC domain-containing protein n=1 Tax=Acer saccharum TaxID=4024 RepID=A0AA39S9N8_ACESA|nr:hypothetical protein LWI29_026246 [Acer saccharum]